MRTLSPALPGLFLAGILSISCRGGPQESRDSSARSDSTPSIAVSIQDVSGRVHVFTEPPRRILSLVPSATQILIELNAQDLLVGRTDWDTAGSLADLPSVGGGLRPSLERVVSLEPDLVIRFQGESDQVTPRRLDDLGIPHFAIQPDGIADVKEGILQLGALVGRRERADSVVEKMEAELDRIRERVRGLPRPSVVYVLGGTPPMVAGPGTFIHELLEIAGAENAFADLPRRYAPVSPEELVSREIDVLLHPLGVSPQVRAEGMETLTASPLMEAPGPRLAEAALELARTLHPEAFR